MTEIAAVREQDLNSWKRCRKIWLVAGLAFGFIGIVGTLICVRLEWEAAQKPFATLLWVFWTVIPPAWFIVEYWSVKPSPLASGEIKSRFDQFKYSQGLAAKLWAGIVAALAAFVLGHL
jgi:hypothetical protein